MPPTTRAALLVRYLSELGVAGQGMSGPVPITASELSDWAQGTATDLGPADFQQLLEASRMYVSAVAEFMHNDVPAPWVPEMTAEEQAAAARREERMFDRMMGVANA